MKEDDFPYFLLMLAGCCFIIHLFEPGQFTLLAGFGLGILSGLTMIVGALFPIDKKDQ